MSAQGASLVTTLRAGQLPRLCEAVARGPQVQDRPLDAEIAFGKGVEARPVVQIRVHGVLQLVCQRCLAPVGWPVDVDVALTAVASEAQAAELADPFDSILLDEEGGLLLRTAVEDEILAALPLVPRHAEEAVCGKPGFGADDSAGAAVTTVNRPFAGLEMLMGRHGSDGDDK